MNPIINYLICFVLIISIIVILLFFIKTTKESHKMKNDFIRYLEGKNDYRNLINFGFYNENGFKESRRIPFLYKIIYEQYQTNKDENFLKYFIYIKHGSRKLIFLYFLAFVLFCILTILMNMD